MIALFPGLPTVQFLITSIYSFCTLEGIKNWMVGRPGKEARLLSRSAIVTTQCSVKSAYTASSDLPHSGELPESLCKCGVVVGGARVGPATGV